ncbi:Ig-like domain-containing protein [Deferrisoma sp.]
MDRGRRRGTIRAAALWAALLAPLWGMTPVHAVVVGYYDMSAGEGVPAQEPPIRAAGWDQAALSDLSPAAMAGVDVLFVQNPSNVGYGAEYLAHLQDVEDAVRGGKVLVLHDRYVTGAASVLPGGSGIAFVRSFGAQIDILTPGTLVTDGPGGQLDDDSLDGGNFSNHGYAELATLPAGAVPLLSNGNPDQVVTFAYPYGQGWVIYSSIPLDFYLAGRGPPGVSQRFQEVYAPNVLAYAASLLGAAPPPKKNAPPDAHNMVLLVAEDEATTAQLDAEDPDGDTLRFRVVAGPSKGTVELLDQGAGLYVYTPAPDATGTDLFRYEAADPDGASDKATVIVLIAARNDAPAGEPVEFSTTQGVPVVGFLLASDPEGGALEFAIVDAPSLGQVELLDPQKGLFRYTPAPGVVGTDTFTFSVSDGSLTSPPVEATVVISAAEQGSGGESAAAEESPAPAPSGDEDNDLTGFGCFLRTLGR